MELSIEELQALERTKTFLEENEQYGDDWSEEIAVLEKIITRFSE